MQHVHSLDRLIDGNSNSKSRLINSLSGRFYTGFPLAKLLATDVCRQFDFQDRREISIADPFCGDGRLIGALLDELNGEKMPLPRLNVSIWDMDPSAVENARQLIEGHCLNRTIAISVFPNVCDSFEAALGSKGKFDIVVTNPPWENLKPDTREIGFLSSDELEEYKSDLKKYDAFLCEKYPHSSPCRRFAGWGLNLSRPGIELSNMMRRVDCVAGIICPASFLADKNSVTLRRWLLDEELLVRARYFPAEAKLFGKADVQSAEIILADSKGDCGLFVTKHNKLLEEVSDFHVSFDEPILMETEYVIPASLGKFPIELLKKLSSYKTLGELAGKGEKDPEIWAGREIDESHLKKKVLDFGVHPFLRGRQIGRYKVREKPEIYLNLEEYALPKSCNFSRIAWRDISRPSQKRRVQSAIIPKGWVTGNSVGVLHFLDGDEARLKALLAIFNSMIFEFQLRFHLTTGHVTLSALRKVRIPIAKLSNAQSNLLECHLKCASHDRNSEHAVEAIVAILYGLSTNEFLEVVSYFDHISPDDKSDICNKMTELRTTFGTGPNSEKLESNDVLFNHHSAKLSDLDLEIARHVPAGGNWKNVPESVPCKRLTTIRESYARGEGSRSTYYGRLRPDAPSYTINTYFTRPGNGCHLHYDFENEQHRVISYREAARFQTFPDSFEFLGSRTSIANQIGNAVPPVLAFQLAASIGKPGAFIDLFAGAGGLSYGFHLAGWRCLLANDIEKYALLSHEKNIPGEIVLGDIRDKKIKAQIVRRAKEYRRQNPNKPLWIIGGPPCQGFSTAGKRRSVEDERNHLFWDYKNIIEEVKPNGFMFENVAGLLNMEKGTVFKEIKSELGKTMVSVEHWIMCSEQFAVPQRRKRVIIVGTERRLICPRELTSFKKSTDLFQVTPLPDTVTAKEAIGDLPSLVAGEDGSSKQYTSSPQNQFQEFMRGVISVQDYLKGFES